MILHYSMGRNNGIGERLELEDQDSSTDGDHGGLFEAKSCKLRDGEGPGSLVCCSSWGC